MEGVAEVSVVQEYVNREQKAIEVIYYFPVEEGAAVTKVEAEVGNRKVVGKVKERVNARQEYQDAIRRGSTAIMVEEVKADIVQLRVGRIGPGAVCKVWLTYLLEAGVEDEKTRLTLPTTLAPRYRPSTHLSHEAEAISSIRHTDSSPPLSLRLEVLTKSRIISLTSPSHTLVANQEKVEGDMHSMIAYFDGLIDDMDRDLVVLVATEAGHYPQFLVEKGENSTAILLTLVPRLEDLVPVPSEVVFLIDCSGSMRGQSISMAKEALSLFLNSLPTDSRFNIVRFGSRMEMLFSSSQAYTDSTLEDARALVRSLDADMGGTEILRPLQTILNQPEQEGRPKQLFVITDGAVSNSRECIQLVGAHRRNTRVFSLGIGSAADRHLVKGLARAGGGTAAFTVEGEQLAGKVLAHLRQALAPSLYPVTVDWGLEVEGEGVQHCQVPRTPSAIFHSSRFSVFRLFSGEVKVGGKVVLTAGDQRQELEVEKESSLAGDLIHKMFAKRMIQELEDSQVGPREEELIKDLSIKYSILSRFTSFICVDQETEAEVGEMMVRQVDNMAPYGTAPGTASAGFLDLQVVARCRSVSAPSSGVPRVARLQAPRKEYGSTDTRTMNLHEKMMALMSLQTASGHFKEDEMMGEIIGKPLDELKALAPDARPELMESWLTALVIAFLELKCPQEKNLWQMSVDKAKAVLPDVGLIQIAKDKIENI